MSKVLITGAGGYVGGRLVGLFLERGWDVHGLVRDPAPRLAIEQTVCDLAEESSLEQLARACAEADAVVHLAGEDEVIAAQRPAVAMAATVAATERVCEAAAAGDVKRLVYLSTVHVYGARMVSGAVLTEDLRVEPRSAYAISRLASEHAAASLSGDGYELAVLRLTNSVGAPDHPSVDRWTLVANDLCRQGVLTGLLELRSSGMQWRDFVPLAGVCSAIAAAAGAGERPLPPGTYNLGSGESITVRGLAELIQRSFEAQTGHRPPLKAPEPELHPPGPYRVSINRATASGIRIGESLEAAVEETVRFCLQHREELQ